MLEEEETCGHGWSCIFEWSDAIDDRGWMRRAAKKLIELAPNNPDAHHRMGEFMERCEEWGLAREAHDQASRLDPSNLESGSRAFQSALSLDDLDAATETLERMRPFLSAVGAAACETMHAAAAGGRKEALAKFQRVVADPEAGRVTVNLAFEAVCSKGWTDDAVRIFREQVGSAECSPEAAAAIVAWFKEQSRWEDARQFVDRLLDDEKTFSLAAMELLSGVSDPGWERVVGWFLGKYEERLRSNDELWGQAAHAILTLREHKRVVKWMADWRERKAEPWMLLNLTLALRHLKHDRDAMEVSRAAAALPKDHATPSHEAWLAWEAARRGEHHAAWDHLSRAPDEQVAGANAAALKLALALAAFAELDPRRRKSGSKDLRAELIGIQDDYWGKPEQALCNRIWRRTVAAAYLLCPTAMMWLFRARSVL